MTTYNDLVSVGNVPMTAQQLDEIFSAAADSSAVMRLGRRLRNMTTSELVLKVSTALPQVYFVGTAGTTGMSFPTGTAGALKQTTASGWENVSIYAGELASIVVIPNNVFNDASFDIFGEIRSQMPVAVGKKVDEAVLYGTSGLDVPSNWLNGVFTAMPAAMKVANTALGDIYNRILGPSGTYAKVEGQGYDVNGNVGAISLKAQLRGLRDGTTGVPLFTPSIQSPSDYTLAGVPITFPTNGSFDVSKTLLIDGDWDKLVWSLRQDVAMDVFTQGIIQDSAGAIVHNLLQEDLTALRITFRMAWGLPNPIQWNGVTGSYPFAALIP